MSLSSSNRSFSESKAIPKRMFISDPSQLPNDYSTTPGGTLYSTTPGGTRIVYERSVLMNLRNSPISQTPPKYSIPNGVMKGTPHTLVGNNISNSTPIVTIDEASEQFPMEI